MSDLPAEFRCASVEPLKADLSANLATGLQVHGTILSVGLHPSDPDQVYIGARYSLNSRHQGAAAHP